MMTWPSQGSDGESLGPWEELPFQERQYPGANTEVSRFNEPAWIAARAFHAEQSSQWFAPYRTPAIVDTLRLPDVKEIPLPAGLISSASMRTEANFSESLSSASTRIEANLSESLSSASTRAEAVLSESHSSSISSSLETASKKGTTRFVFCLSLQQIREFDLVPKLIGHGGANLKSIAVTHNAKIRLRGVGSGFKEVSRPSGKTEASIPLQLCVSCLDGSVLDIVRAKLIKLLDQQAKSFKRYCKSRDIVMPANLYVEVAEGSKEASEHYPNEQFPMNGAQHVGPFG